MKQFFDDLAGKDGYWKKKNNYYNKAIRNFASFYVEPGRKVLEMGCGGGVLLEHLKPSEGIGIDISPLMLEHAREEYPSHRYFVDDAAAPRSVKGTFDYIIASDLIGYLGDIFGMFRNARAFCNDDTRFIITFYNFLWEPLIKILEFLRIKIPMKRHNWLRISDVENLLRITGYTVINKGRFLLFPVWIPLVSRLINGVIANIPFINYFCFVQYVIARRLPEVRKDLACSVIVPCLDERGNIEKLVTEIPEMGNGTEIIFVDGGSKDGTVAEIERLMASSKRDIKLIHQGEGIGKGDAVRKGFAAAKNELLFIFDSDITVAPETLPEFYEIVVSGRGEFVNGCRLVYPLEKQSMRFLNILGNHFFSVIFTYLLNQRIKDTLCGTKVLTRSGWDRIVKNRGYFGDFDPFGDFDLLFGATKLSLDIVELPVQYRARTYGDIKIQRFRHGLLLLRMSWIALKKLKLGMIL